MERLQDGLLWTNRYPLKISIPRTETARSTLRFRHTAYLIEIDDCGKIYTRHRRFTNFVWLHGELRRRELGVDLPELPPKKSIGNMDPGFIERRRSTLQDYLQKLLHLPLVVQDDALWAFLDADLATAAVPRFLCRPRTQAAVTECFMTLEKVVAKQANVFRFCNDAVTQEFIEFAKAEAEGDREATSSNRSAPSSAGGYAHSACPQRVQQAMRTKLQNRARFCNVLQHLIMHERARQGMVDLGMFGALIKLLARSVEDNEASPDETFSEDYRRICVVSRDNLQALLEGSNGAALLNFCQQDDGLSTLKRLANGNDSLHQICASLLWLGLQNKDVVDALVGSAQDNNEIRPGLTLLGCLLKSPDLRARILAALCLSTVVRNEGALAEDDCLHCREAIRGVPEQLDTAENDAIERTASNNLDKASLATLDKNSLLELKVDRDPALVTQMKSLCCAKDLPRLLPLLGDSGIIDEVTSLVVVLLHTFVQQFSEEPALFRDLGILAEPLQRIVEVEEGTIEETSWVSQIRIRAAQILILLDWGASGEVAGDPPHLSIFTQRAKILEVLNGYSLMCQEKSGQQLDSARAQRTYQDDVVSAGGLTQALCIGEARLNEFAREVSSLETKRRTLQEEMENSTKAIDDMNENLERHGIKKIRLKSDIDAIYESIIQQGDLLSRSDSAEVAARCEDIHKEVSAQVEQRTAEKKAIEADLDQKQARQHEAEAEWKELLRRETELAEVCNTAPAQLQRVQASLRECERRLLEIGETSEKLESAQRHGEHRISGLQERKEEAEGGLKKVRDMKTKLEAFQQALNSEIVLTDAEVAKLREFDVELQPTRPARLRKASELSLESTEGEESAPSWEDITAEQEFRSTPHFRSFSKLVAERKQHWEAELAWIEELLAHARGTVADIMKKKALVDQQHIQAREEEARLHDQEKAIADFDGHTLRHTEAEKAALEAREIYLQMTSETAEASNALQMTTTLLEDAQSEKFQADIDLNKARETERAETAVFLQARVELESRTTELEGRTRGFLQEWRDVELEEHRLNLLQNRVVEQLQEEARGRMILREEARRLIAELQDLDRQLEDVSEYDIGLNALAG